MSVSYSCSHLATPYAPLPPSYPSSSTAYHPLNKLYFCEECDATRCDLCVGVEIASYFCPNCLFDVPSANVRADKNRCARSCFSCPLCESSLSIQASDQSPTDISTIATSSSSGQAGGPPYTLVCPGCKWSSKEIGWNFDKPTGIALQLSKINTLSETVQSEFDLIKEHLESYITHSTPTPSAPSSARSSRNPSRHISNLTQMAQKALHRNVGGMTAYPAAFNSRRPNMSNQENKENVGWDELAEYRPKTSWRQLGLERGLEDAEKMREIQEAGPDGLAGLDKRWKNSWENDRSSKAMTPQRIPLQTKLTKRCPHPNCRHLLIQPDTKTVRMKIKMTASNYLPLIEIGRKRRRLPNTDEIEEQNPTFTSTEDIDCRRRERRRTRGILVKEEDEPMDSTLTSGETYSFQLALINPLYDPIQIRLTQPHTPRNAPTPKCTVNIPTPHFTINALKDAWAYDEEDENEDILMGGSEAGLSEEGTTTTGTTTTANATGTLSKKSRFSILANTGVGVSNKKLREGGVEKKGNMSKVNLDVELSKEAKGKIEFDLEVRYTYKAEDIGTPTDKEGKDKSSAKKSKDEYKHFTFWIRVKIGQVV
ncbi:uncharacterized protein IL334_002471 [Kwoniella shivajii]|uniref:Dynactin subunit 4 n=1 Tax=Kwoniella shivajii TaxID=564305 RepID=A0ABZ1CXW5_9TREE|nr:hypothetical protein IL334_002471 [Kwoniella shivajii]